MRSNNRGLSALIRGAGSALLLMATLTACTSIAGGAALLGAIGIAALTSRCYDYVDVVVFDADGRKTCNATVTAKKGNSEFTLPPCYNASLTDGLWTLRASLPGSADARTTVLVDHAHDCTRYVQSVELSLHRADMPPPAPRPFPSPPSAAPLATDAALSPALPSAQPAAPASASPPIEPTASPTASSTPPVGVFPDSPPPTH